MNSWGEAFGEKGTLRLLRQDSEEWVLDGGGGNSCQWSFPIQEPTVGCNQNLENVNV